MLRPHGTGSREGKLSLLKVTGLNSLHPVASFRVDYNLKTNFKLAKGGPL
jgi:hypothetical protein